MKIKKGMMVSFTPYDESWKEIHIDESDYNKELKGQRLQVVGFELIDGIKHPQVQIRNSPLTYYVKFTHCIFKVKSNKPSWF